MGQMPPNRPLILTRFPRLLSPHDFQTVTTIWPEFVASLVHTPLADKSQSPLFGPYELTAPPSMPPRRGDGFVRELTMAVFDADAGTLDDITQCEQNLIARNVTHAWYSSYSYSDTKPAFRLVILLDAPVPSSAWPTFRSAVVRSFQIPCNLSQCSAPSHAYYLPSCPPSPPTPPVVEHFDGQPLKTGDFPLIHVPYVEVLAHGDFEWPEPDEAETPAPDEATRTIKNRIRGLKQRKTDKTAPHKAELLERLLAGEALDTPGNMHAAARSTTAMLAYLFPYASRSFFAALLEKSVVAMMKAGATDDAPSNVLRMLESALRKEQTRLEADASLREIFKESRARALALAEAARKKDKGDDDE